jgi:hypothetical protein|tara:strand:+ start:547 stop:2973 length:2427 start_codon:yes stop_codon:yes gene_type:complete
MDYLDDFNVTTDNTKITVEDGVGKKIDSATLSTAEKKQVAMAEATGVKLDGKKDEKPKVLVKQYVRDFIDNPLHDYESYNAVFTLAALTVEEVNFPNLLYNRMPLHPIAHSTGKGKIEEVTFYKQAGVNLEYFIDNVEIESQVTPSPKTKFTQKDKIRFTVTEPYSIGLFLQTMAIQAAKASDDGNAQYLTAPYALIVDFVGQDATGKIFRNSNLRKVMPIQMTKAAIRASQAGAVYDCEAAPWTQTPVQDINNTINTDITLAGKTVYEMMQVGDNSLMGQLNFKGEDLDKKAKKKEQLVTLPTDDYVIYFPMKSEVEYTEAERKLTLKDRAIVADRGTGELGDYYFNTEKRDIVVETLLGKNVRVTNEYTGTSGQGIRVFQTDGEGPNATFLGNDIGASKMAINENNMAIIGKRFPNFEEKYDKRKKTFTRDGITLDLKQMTLSFKKGTRISDIIETVILLSEYAKNLTKNPDEMKNKQPGKHPWFRVRTKCFQLQDQFFKMKTQNHPRLNVFSIVPYQVPDTIFDDDTSLPSGYSVVRQNIVKGYNYLYTGLNKDVLDFDLTYNFGFYNELPKNLYKSSSTSSAGGNKSIEKNATATPSVIYDIVDSSEDKAGSISARVIKPQSNQRGEGTENESVELKVARAMNDRIINGGISDLILMDLTIIGDPYFLPASAMMNSDEPTRFFVDPRPYATTPASQKNNGNGRGEINYQDTYCFIEMNFQTPIDYQPGGDQLIFPQGGAYENGAGQTIRLGEFSGVYQVQTIMSSFREGKFEQTLRINRQSNMTLNATEGSGNKKKIQKKNSKD